jgi:hypothetical protein
MKRIVVSPVLFVAPGRAGRFRPAEPRLYWDVERELRKSTRRQIFCRFGKICSPDDSANPSALAVFAALDDDDMEQRSTGR